MCRSSSVDHILYYVITFLTLGLIGLVFVSLSQAYPMHTKVSDLTSRAPQASTPCAGFDSWQPQTRDFKMVGRI